MLPNSTVMRLHAESVQGRKDGQEDDQPVDDLDDDLLQAKGFLACAFHPFAEPLIELDPFEQPADEAGDDARDDPADQQDQQRGDDAGDPDLQLGHQPRAEILHQSAPFLSMVWWDMYSLDPPAMRTNVL